MRAVTRNPTTKKRADFILVLVEQDIMNLKAFDGSVYHGRVFADNQFYANQMRYA
jgi:hypothetical protein